MTANKVYYPSLIGGYILGVQLTIQNTSASTVSCSALNGVYYTFDGRDYQLLSLDSVSIASGETEIVSKEFREYLNPTSDIKIMIDTAGMAGCVVSCQIIWGV